MKLIIDIPEEVKHKVYAYGLSLSPSDKEQLIKAIMNGIPFEQTGHWINMEISINGDMSAECDKCGCIVRNSFTNNAINYCPNCGASMVEQQTESEDKNEK